MLCCCHGWEGDRDTCGSKTSPSSGVALGLAHPSGRLLLLPLYCALTAQLFSIELSITPFSGTCTLSLTLKEQPECHLWPGVEKQRGEVLSCSSLEGNFGTVVSCGSNYEYYSDSLVLGKGISGRYVMVEVLTFFAFLLGFGVWWVVWLGFFSAWSVDLEISSRKRDCFAFCYIYCIFENYFILFKNNFVGIFFGGWLLGFFEKHSKSVWRHHKFKLSLDEVFI